MSVELLSQTSLNLIPAIEERLDQYISWRRYLHQYPETAFEEVNTADFVSRKLESFGIEVHKEIGVTGVVGVLKGKQDIGETIALRSELDALPINELNTFEHCSKTTGKMHACGHDGHMIMLLAAAEYLSKNNDFKGRVVFIFQPAEEHGGGANVMIQDNLLCRFAMDQIFCLHNWPEGDKHSFLIKKGPMLSANAEMKLTVIGKGGHAASPEFANDPIVISAQIINALQNIVSRYVEPLDAVVLSITQIHGGELAVNAIPDRVTMAASLRFINMKTKQRVYDRIRSMIKGICDGFSSDFELEFIDGYPVTENSALAVNNALKAAIDTVGVGRVITEAPPMMASEDFSFFAQHIPACYAFLGSGEEGQRIDCHNPNYDFNDSIIPTGASYFVHLIEKMLPLKTVK